MNEILEWARRKKNVHESTVLTHLHLELVLVFEPRDGSGVFATYSAVLHKRDIAACCWKIIQGRGGYLTPLANI